MFEIGKPEITNLLLGLAMPRVLLVKHQRQSDEIGQFCAILATLGDPWVLFNQDLFTIGSFCEIFLISSGNLLNGALHEPFGAFSFQIFGQLGQQFKHLFHQLVHKQEDLLSVSVLGEIDRGGARGNANVVLHSKIVFIRRTPEHDVSYWLIEIPGIAEGSIKVIHLR